MKNKLQRATISMPVLSFKSFQFFSILFSFVLFLTSCQKEVITPASNAHLPAMIAMDPIYNETDVELQKSITATFDQDIDPSKFLVSFSMQTDTLSVAGSVSINGNQAVFTPDMAMNPDTEYIAVIDVTENIQGARTMERHFLSVFRTKP